MESTQPEYIFVNIQEEFFEKLILSKQINIMGKFFTDLIF
jgi:hypothetical protein